MNGWGLVRGPERESVFARRKTEEQRCQEKIEGEERERGDKWPGLDFTLLGPLSISPLFRRCNRIFVSNSIHY